MLGTRMQSEIYTIRNIQGSINFQTLVVDVNRVFLHYHFVLHNAVGVLLMRCHDGLQLKCIDALRNV